jgi:transposase
VSKLHNSIEFRVFDFDSSLLERSTVVAHIQGMHRHEESLFPERLDDSSAAETPVRFIAACVDALALAPRGFQRVQAAATGRPASYPGALVTRSIYGSRYRLRSSRRLEQETQRNVALLWRLKTLRPDHQTMATFRRDNLPPLRQVCRAVTLWGTQLALFSGALVALDGSTFQAVHATERHFPQSKLQRRLPQIEARLAAYRNELERGDTEADHGAPGGARAEPRHAQLAALQQRPLLYAGCQGPLRDTEQEQRSRTAPDRRAMQLGKGSGTEVCDNVQTAGDAQHKLSRAGDVPNETRERDWLSPMARQATAVLERPVAAGADLGDSPGDEVQACLEAGMTPSSARPLTSANQTLGRFRTADCRDARATDTSQCPAGARLTCRCETVERGRPSR